VTTAALTLATIGGARFLFAQVLQHPYTKDQVLAGMQLQRGPVTAVVLREVPSAPRAEQGPLLDRIRGRGILRVGYLPNSLPFAFFNGRGDLVGFDVELAHRLASELHVGLEFVPCDRDALVDQLAAGVSDIVMSGVAVTTLRASRTVFSASYLDETMGFVVADEQRGRFETWNSIRAAGHLTIAVPDVSYYIDKIHELIPDAAILKFDSDGLSALLAGGAKDIDAFALPAERGSAWTLMYPRFSVVVPEPATIRIPLAYPLGRDDRAFETFINTWIELKRKDRTIADAYEHWILGRSAERPTRRWSIIRDVFHWVE
jgi:ABC-type amino acid transport substrate-binding protein